MNPRRIHELEGARLAFAQGGSQGFRLIMLTPPVHVVRHENRCELTWKVSNRPFRYDRAPVLIDNDGTSDFPLLKRIIRLADRNTWSQRFSSCFRSRRTPLREDVVGELIRVYHARVKGSPPELFARGYADTMPYPPNNIDGDRKRTYERFLSHAASKDRRRRRC